MSDESAGAGTDVSGMVMVPRRRLEELLLLEEARAAQGLTEPEVRPPTVADWFNGFRARVAQRDRERRG